MLTQAGLPGAPPRLPYALEVLLRPFAAGKAPGVPGLLQPHSWDCWVHSVGRGGLYLCVCVCAHPLLPRGRGAPALHPPPCLGPLVVISPPSAEYTYFFFCFFFFFLPLLALPNSGQPAM